MRWKIFCSKIKNIFFLQKCFYFTEKLIKNDDSERILSRFRPNSLLPVAHMELRKSEAETNKRERREIYFAGFLPR